MKHIIQIAELTPEQFKDLLTDTIKDLLQDSNLKKLMKQHEIDKYLTREETAKVLRISLPTLSQLTSEGLLKGYKVGRRVLYKQVELSSCLSEIETRLNTRHQYHIDRKKSTTL